MKKLVKVMALVMTAVLLVCSLAACGSSSDKIKIGIIQLTEHDALNQAYQGFVDGLKAAGYEDGKNIELDLHNAQNDQSNCQTIAEEFVTENKDLILAIATPAAQAVAAKTTTIPTLITAVTDPAGSDLVASNSAPGGNITGTSDLNPVDEQAAYIQKVLPNVKQVGILYCSSESNSKLQCDLMTAALNKLGISVTEFTVPDTNDVQQVTEYACSKVEAIYIPTDNTLASSMATVSSVTLPKKVPVFCGEESMVKSGGFLTIGINYYNLGKQTAEMAVRILKDGQSPATMPVEYQKDYAITVNEEALNALGITLPEDIASKATLVKPQAENAQ